MKSVSESGNVCEILGYEVSVKIWSGYVHAVQINRKTQSEKPLGFCYTHESARYCSVGLACSVKSFRRDETCFVSISQELLLTQHNTKLYNIQG